MLYVLFVVFSRSATTSYEEEQDEMEVMVIFEDDEVQPPRYTDAKAPVEEKGSA
jgi:hypothetical protein